MTKQWSKHKVLLHQLYILQRIKLKKVMEIMRGKHNFVACRRTYMKMFSRWGYQKNRKSRARREGGSSGGVNKEHSEAELNAWEADTYAPTYKINGISHQTEVLIQGSTIPEVIVEPAVSDKTTGGNSSPLDEFADSNDLFQYVRFIEGALLLNEIKKKALLSRNPDPHLPAMSEYQQALGKIISDQNL